MPRRRRIQIGRSQVNASDLRGLREAWRSKRLVFFLGAGVSIPYGFPTWKDLVLELLFVQAERTRRLGAMSPHHRRALAAWMTDYFEYDPLVLARMVERELGRRSTPSGQHAFLETLRRHLYDKTNRKLLKGPTALRSAARLIHRTTAKRGVAAVVTFNFDDLLERELRSLGVRVQSIVDGSRRYGSGFPVIHPHGFVPEKGPIDRRNIVFTETDYHGLTESVFHWALSEIVGYLRNHTVLFVGLSMSDPSLRRLLDACRNSDVPSHWQIQKRHEIRDQEALDVMSNVEKRAQAYAKVLRVPGRRTPAAIGEKAINDALRQADTYDRQVFESMGVKTIWVEDWDDIPAVIDAIDERRTST